MDLFPPAADSATTGAGMPGQADDKNIQVGVERLGCVSGNEIGLGWLKPDMKLNIVILK